MNHYFKNTCLLAGLFYYKENLESYKLNKWDILIAMSCKILDTDFDCYLNQKVGKFVPNEKILNNRFYTIFYSQR